MPETQGHVCSSDMTDACKTICKVCKVQVTLNYMRTHSKNKHRMTINEYKDMFGNHRDQIVKEVYHMCGFCHEEIMLDADSIDLHVRRRHKISLKEYNANFITGSQRKLKTEVQEKNPETEDSFVKILNKVAFDCVGNVDLDTIREIENLFDTW